MMRQRIRLLKCQAELRADTIRIRGDQILRAFAVGIDRPFGKSVGNVQPLKGIEQFPLRHRLAHRGDQRQHLLSGKA